MNKRNYSECLTYVDEFELNEKYALVSHYIQLSEKPEAQKYRDELVRNGFDVRKLPTDEEFNSENNIPMTFPLNPSFTFIDLFAGIGGFRIAMQSVGGKCVFFRANGMKLPRRPTFRIMVKSPLEILQNRK